MKDKEVTIQELTLSAQNAQKRAYAPYSKFHVGAAILAEDGKIYSGCNVENAAYPLGQCAEGGAISAMIANGANEIQAVMIASPIEDICPPCGACRQKIAEFGKPETQIMLLTNTGDITHTTLAELLPMAFSLDKNKG